MKKIIGQEIKKVALDIRIKSAFFPDYECVLKGRTRLDRERDYCFDKVVETCKKQEIYGSITAECGITVNDRYLDSFEFVFETDNSFEVVEVLSGLVDHEEASSSE